MDTVADKTLHTLRDIVQHNCHISDANHAGNYTMCTYLLKMREYFRWEQQKSASSKLKNTQVGEWLRERENLWDSLETANFKKITIKNQCFDPFDADSINAIINTEGLVYSGGFGAKMTPHFFLAKIESQENYDNYTVYISSTEYARDLTSPPAMTLGNNIFIRRESIKRMLWERYETWLWNKPENAMKNAIDCYDFANNLDASLDAMTDNEIENILLHEIGEIQAGELLGEQWEELLSDLPHTQAELMLRAIRDHIADSIITLPTLMHSKSNASIHFYFANLTNMRKHLAPSLLKAYDKWLYSNDFSNIKNVVSTSRDHWLELTDKIFSIYNKTKNPQKQIEALIESSHL